MARRPTSADRDLADRLAAILGEIMPQHRARPVDWRNNFVGETVWQRDIPEATVDRAIAALRDYDALAVGRRIAAKRSGALAALAKGEE